MSGSVDLVKVKTMIVTTKWKKTAPAHTNRALILIGVRTRLL